jgi:hypothetical protein
LAYKTLDTNKTMSEEISLGPIAEIRHSKESPLALTVGALFGGAAPLVNFSTVHLADLVVFDLAQKKLTVNLESPLWFMVAGSFVLSSKSVFRWAYSTFGDWVSALGLVFMLEGCLVFAPHIAMGVIALVFLVALNAAAYGSVLSLRDQKDKKAIARSAALEEQQPEEQQQQLVAQLQEVPVLSLTAETRAPNSAPRRKNSKEDLYARAVKALCGFTSISVENLRETLGVRQPTAAELMVQLERNGAVGQPDLSDYGRRPVLIRAETWSV